MMKTTKLLLILSIVLVVIVGGCSKGTQKAPEQTDKGTGTTGEAVDSLDQELSDVGSVDDESDLGSLDNLDKDLDIGY